MIKKKRTKSSYYGNTPEAIKRQRDNLIPGNPASKRRRKEIRLNCWWEVMPLGNIQDIYELCENKRSLEDTPKKELKSEKYLNDWWGKLDLESKKFIYKNTMPYLTKESRSEILKDMEKCLKEKLKKVRKREVRGLKDSFPFHE